MKAEKERASAKAGASDADNASAASRPGIETKANPLPPTAKEIAPTPGGTGTSKPLAPLPPVLLEGDAVDVRVPAGPGRRFVMGPSAPPPRVRSPESAALPVAYGTGKMLLVARDPHWLFAHWDLTDSELRECNRRSASGHLVVRVYRERAEGDPIVEQGVHPESRSWFLHVPHASRRYMAELGFVDAARAWHRVCVSPAAVTPAEQRSEDTRVRFETLPVDGLRDGVQAGGVVEEGLSPANRGPDLPAGVATPAARTLPALAPEAAWNPEQERLLARWSGNWERPPQGSGSLEIAMAIAEQAFVAISSLEIPSGPGMPVTAISSPGAGAPARDRGFWFGVNAELVIYGATDPGATVHVGGRAIELRNDGTFSFRFALPDGDYRLPLEATSPDGEERRTAELTFRRASEYNGEVGRVAGADGLKPPSPDSLG